jgi:hypothetical protein
LTFSEFENNVPGVKLRYVMVEGWFGSEGALVIQVSCSHDHGAVVKDFFDEKATYGNTRRTKPPALPLALTALNPE